MQKRHALFFRPWYYLSAALAVAFALTPAVAQKNSSDALYGADGVSPQTVRQGSLGSCYFHASIASLAQLTPATLRSAISSNPDGSYQVRFFDGTTEQVYPEDVEYGRTHGFDNSQGRWVLVLMRGYAQRTVRQSLQKSIQQSDLIPMLVKPLALSWLDQSGMLLVAYDRTIRSVIQQDGTLNKVALKRKLTEQLKTLGVPDMEAGILEGFLDERGIFDALALSVQQNGEVYGDYKGMGQGGIPERVMVAFLGHGSTGIVATDKQMPEQLDQLHAGKMSLVAITWGTAPNAEFQDGAPDWWVHNHAYSVLDYDAAAQTVRLRNPWGDHPAPDGSFTIPLATYLKAFQIYSEANSEAQ